MENKQTTGTLYNNPDLVFPQETPQGVKDAIERFSEQLRELKDALQKETESSGIEFCKSPFDLSVVVAIALGCTKDGEKAHINHHLVYSEKRMVKHSLRCIADNFDIHHLIL